MKINLIKTVELDVIYNFLDDIFYLKLFKVQKVILNYQS